MASSLGFLQKQSREPECLGEIDPAAPANSRISAVLKIEKFSVQK